MKIFDSIKFGFGFYIGYEAAKKAKGIVKELYPVIKDRFKKGYF